MNFYIILLSGIGFFGLLVNLINVYRAYEGIKLIDFVVNGRGWKTAAQKETLQADYRVFKNLLALSSIHCALFACIIAVCLVAYFLTNNNTL